MNPYLISRKVPTLDRSKDWFRSCYLNNDTGASQLLWQSVEPYPKYPHKHKRRNPTSCEGDQFQQCFLVYDPAADKNLLHLYYLSYVHGGYADKVLRCNHADYRYYVLWVEEGAGRISCIDYVRYHGSYLHEHGNSWWAKMAMDRDYAPLPGTPDDLLRRRLGLPDGWELDTAFVSTRRDAPDTARYMGWYDYIVTSDWRKENVPLIEMREYIDDTWHPRILCPNGQEAATQQLRVIEQELVARTWHPKRFLDWCIPACEKEDLAPMSPEE